MIDALVNKMPQQSREQFEHFFLQLSLIASTTTRLRAALESGDAQATEEIMDAAENVGILQFLLKMAVTQAGQEVLSSQGQHNDWVDRTDAKMGPLLRGQADAMISQKALAQARADLGASELDAKEKSKKVLLGMISGQTKALAKNCFDSWKEIYQKNKREAEIRKEYEEEIQVAQKRLLDYSAKQLENIKGVIMRSGAAKQAEMQIKLFQELKDAAKEKKADIAAQAEIAELEAKMKGFAENSSANAKKVLSRMNAANERGLLSNGFKGWQEYMVDCKKEKELESAVREAEERVKAFQAKQNSGAQSVLTRMASANEGALIQMCLKAWVEWYVELKRANELEEAMNGANAKFSNFANRNKNSAKSATQRAADALDDGDKILVFGIWKREARIERLRKYGKEKNAKRKQQLMGVKGLFKNFATELEQGLKDGTPRVEAKKRSDDAP